MKRIVNITICIFVFLLTLTGCNNKNKNDLSNENSSKSSTEISLNCIKKEETMTKRNMYKFNSSNDLASFTSIWDFNWGSLYGGGTEQVYEIANKLVREQFDSKLPGINYKYEFYKEGNAVGKFEVKKEMVEKGEVTTIDGINMKEFFSFSKEEVNKYMVLYDYYCTSDTSENWDIFIENPLYEFLDVFLAFKNEDVTYTENIKYQWYGLTLDLKIMTITYMLDYEGYIYAYDDYDIPTLDEEIERIKKESSSHDSSDYINWLYAMKEKYGTNSN